MLRGEQVCPTEMRLESAAAIVCDGAREDQGILRVHLSFWTTARHFGRICGSLVDDLALIRVERFPQQAMTADAPDESIAVRGAQCQRVAVVACSIGLRSVDALSGLRPHSRTGPRVSRRRTRAAAYCPSIWFWPSSPPCPACSLPKFDL